MNDKKYVNTFRFSLNQGRIVDNEFEVEVLLGEAIFDADQFNPFTRYSINIRDILPWAITRIQKILSRRNYNVIAEVGNDKSYDLFDYRQKMIASYSKKYRNDMRYNPDFVVQQIENKTIKGVPCKIGFYINENPIVEREFFVDGFNPTALVSIDVTQVIREITNTIKEKIKTDDIRNICDDYDLINCRGLSFNQIRELHPAKRAEILRRMRSN
jgi:hypothetical protein